ncbi:YidB family protein [Alsobacter sp. SYSU M60028]|uniref:YidB family protein n=1 Tax=Alsobacter ponti TaxID=2962936 RepID=A0ABT1LIS0_9HYPH|nr:YidB family protein [Alsobacter ponti]MCP8941038.1 YidB family protein [Alsobacter ponti]
MSRDFPSMTALLGLLAVAGFQNRDKIAEMLGGSQSSNPNAVGQGEQQGGLGGLLGNLTGGGLGTAGQGNPQGGLGGLLGGLMGGGIGSLLNGGLGELVERFNQNGQGDVAQSWVSRGPNQPIQPDQLEQAIGPDVLETVAQQTGLSREDLLTRLSTTLPEAVDKFTPDGRLPAATDVQRT